MANLQNLRRRIRSVKNMQQITKAMKLVSASKLKRSHDRVIAARPYAKKMQEALDELVSRVSEYHHPLTVARGNSRYLLMLVTADKGLCGAFNTNLTKAAQQFVQEHSEQHIQIYAVGRKGRDFFRKRRADLVQERIGVTSKQVTYDIASEIADEVMEMYADKERALDGVFLLYNEFKSALQQRVVINQILPIGGKALTTDKTSSLVDPIFEQPPAQILGELLPKLIRIQVFHSLLESVASENGARMAAMDSATRNASEVIDTLTLHMNRVRQASITNEIIEVVSGAAAQ